MDDILYIYRRKAIFLACVGIMFFLHNHQTVTGQDLHFTQFYATKNYLSPAFAGIHGCSRVASAYRDQWPSIPGRFVSSALSFDHNFQSYNSSVGLILTNDVAGSGRLRSTSANFQYAYELPLSDGLRIRAGLQGGLNTRSIDYSRLLFGDQIANGLSGNSVSSDFNLPMVAYADFAAGALIYSKVFWAGISAHHINKPNQSFLRETSMVPVKYSIHGGARIPLDDLESKKKNSKQVLYPAINYKAQGKFDQLDVGLYYEYSGIMLGSWYRGIPLLKAYERGYMNNDAISFLIGYSLDMFNIGYSYDFTISKLAFSSGGAHELTCYYTFCHNKGQKKKKRRINVPCPNF